MGQILVIVETDDGLTGYGVGGGGQAGIHVIETAIRHALTDQDGTDVEGLWQAMYSLTLPYGQKGLAIMAISGVDLALWDLRAKRARRPLAHILGAFSEDSASSLSPSKQTAKPGLVSSGLMKADARPTVPAYRSGWSPEKWISEGTRGFTALKLNLPSAFPDLSKTGVGEVVTRIRKVRNALGPDVQLMVDAVMKLDLETTLRIADGLADVNLGWIEEPLPADDLEGYARLRDECPIPIAGGEHEYTAAAFEVLMKDRLHTIVQPDVTWCGGLTELIKIYNLGKQYNIRVCPHRGSEIWALHAICAIDPEPLAESGRPWMTWVKDQPEIVGGKISLGDAIGFGVCFEKSDIGG